MDEKPKKKSARSTKAAASAAPAVAEAPSAEVKLAALLKTKAEEKNEVSGKTASKAWSGVLSFGLITAPVVMFTGAREDRLSANQIHEPCGGRINSVSLCRACKSEAPVRLKDKDGKYTVDAIAQLPYEEIVDRSTLLKGFETKNAEGQKVRVILSKEEVKALDQKRGNALQVEKFVPYEAIDPVYFDASYYLAAEDVGQQAYSLIRTAMLDSGKVAVARLCLNSNDYVFVIRPYGERGMIVHRLYWNYEVREMAFPDLVECDAEEKELARQLLDAYSADEFNPTDYRDERRLALEKMIADKAAGKEVEIEAVVETPKKPVGSLKDMMKAALAAKKAA